MSLGRLRFALALVGLVPSTHGASWGQEGGERSREVVETLLAEADRLEAGSRLDVVVASLVGLEREHTPALVDAFLRPAKGGSDRRNQALLETFRRLPRRVVSCLRDRTTQGSLAQGERVLAMKILAEVGTATELVLLVDLATPPDPTARKLPRSITDAFGRAFERLLRRNPRAAEVFGDFHGGAHPALLYPAVRGLGSVGTSAALETLLRMFDARHAAAPLILAEVRELADRPEIHAPQALELVRTSMRSSRPSTLIEGIRTAAALDDIDAVEPLIELLEHPESPVREQANLALQRLTGQHLGPERERWDRWYSDQVRWWNGPGREEIERLDARRPSLVARALVELSARRLHRQQIGPRVEAVIRSSEEPEILVLACAAAGQLRIVTAISDLELLLDHDDGRVSSAARSALQRIPGGASVSRVDVP